MYQHCAEVENQAQDMLDALAKLIKKAEGVTEQLKEDNQLEWVCRMQNIETKAKEVICGELIYA